MNSKIAAILEKTLQERGRGHFDKALTRLKDGIQKFPDEIELYVEAADVTLDAGESIKATQFLRRAFTKFPGQFDRLWLFAKEKVKSQNDPILAKFLVEQAVKKRELESAREVLDNLQDHTANELLKRTQTKLKSLNAAAHGGYSLKGEWMTSVVAEALLLLRAKRLREAVSAFLRVLDEKPIEYEVFESFLRQLDLTFAHDGNIQYVLGCCYLAGSRYEKAFQKLIQGLKSAPGHAEDAVARLEAVANKPDAPMHDLKITQAEVHLIAGNRTRAAELFSALLDAKTGRPQLVLDLLKPHVETISEERSLHYVFIEAAVRANRAQSAIQHVRRVYRDRRGRAELLVWLDEKVQERAFPPDLLICYAEIAFKEGLHAKALEVLKEALSLSPAEAPVVRSVLERFRKNPKVDAFYRELSTSAPTPAHRGQLDFEHFENEEFTLDSGAPPPAAGKDWLETSEFQKETPPLHRPASEAARSRKERPASRWTTNPSEGPSLWERAAAGGSPNTRGDARDDEPPSREEDEYTADEPAAGARGEVRFEYETFSTEDDVRPLEEPEPEPTDAEPDRGGADGERPEVWAEDAPEGESDEPDGAPSSEAPEGESQDGADDGDSSGEPVILLGVANDLEDEPEEEDSPDTEPEDAVTNKRGGRSTPAEDFDYLFRLFQQGALKHGKILELIEQAMTTGRMEEMKTLLGFQPDSVAEEIKRKFYLAEYYMFMDQALSALIVLKTVQLNGLSREEKRTFLVKIATCYKELNMYEAAHSTFLRLMSEDPASTEVEHMARQNYLRYLREISGEAPVLEKTTQIVSSQ